MKYILPFITIVFLSSCGGKAITTGLKYTVSDSSESDRSLQLEVTIPVRYSSAQLDTIGAIIKERNALESLVKVYYLLPGQAVGTGLPYGLVFYPDTTQVKGGYKQKDINGNAMELTVNGVPASTAKTLYSFNPPNMATKTILGKFINDAYKTATVIYTDSRERAGYAFIADFDSTGKMIPIVATPIKDENGTKKLIVDTAGHYYTLQDSILKRYEPASNKPWATLKSGY